MDEIRNITVMCNNPESHIIDQAQFVWHEDEDLWVCLECYQREVGRLASLEPAF